MEETKPTRIDSIIAFSFWLSVPLFILLGLYFNVEYIIGFPLIVYGTYALIFNKIWVKFSSRLKGRKSWVQYYAYGGFIQGGKAPKIWGIFYIISGIIIIIWLL